MTVLLKLLAQRLALGLATLFVVSLVIFLSIELLPGDAAQQVLGQSATEENVAAFRKQLGLDQPPHIRYVNWLSGLLQGDLGTSVVSGLPITELIGERIKNTLFLASYAALMAVPLALALGILSALYRGTVLDRSINVVSLAAISVPEFFVAYVLVWFFSVQLGWFPSLSSLSDDAPFSERVYRSFLPALTMMVIVMAHMMRMTRASIINVLALPYVEMARLKGANPKRLVVVHAFPNAVAPIVTVIAINLAYLITGVVIVEVVFVYPGMGQLLVDSVAKRDFTVVQASCLIFSASYILLNLASDLISIATNPRLMHRN